MSRLLRPLASALLWIAWVLVAGVVGAVVIEACRGSR